MFAGTTNADAYLGDETGNRRFWPVKVGAIDLDGLRRDRDQLWAEAVAAYKAGETWWLDAETERAAAEEQAERRIDDPWETALLAWAAARQSEPVTWRRRWRHLGVPTRAAGPGRREPRRPHPQGRRVGAVPAPGGGRPGRGPTGRHQCRRCHQ